MRLFVALEVPDAWRTALGALQDQVQESVRLRLGAAARPRWTRPEGIHITLKFLGQTPAGRLPEIREALSAASAGRLGFEISLGRLSYFDGRRAPRVIFVEVEGKTAPLLALADSVEASLEAAGWEREKRPFRPHLTVARLPEEVDETTCRAVAKLAASHVSPSVPAWRVDRVSLMRSHLGPGGARYERIASFAG